MGDGDGGKGRELPPKVYFRIGEVASLVGVEPHVLRYWEREFRTIRPKKSARGQRVYSRKDVETLMRVRQLLYSEGFTIAGARRRLQQERSGNGAVEPLVEAEVSFGRPQELELDDSDDHDGDGDGAATASLERAAAPAAAAPAPAPAAPAKRVERVAERVRVDHAEDGAMRATLRELRSEIETFLADL